MECLVQGNSLDEDCVWGIWTDISLAGLGAAVPRKDQLA